MERQEQRVPAIALRGMTILPEMITHFDVSRSRSVKAVEQSLAQEQRLFIVAQRNPDTEAPGQQDLFAYGTVAEIKQIVKMPHNILRVLVEGLFRARLVSLEEGECLTAVVSEEEPEDFGDLPESGKEAMLRNLQEIFQGYCDSGKRIGKDLARQVSESRTLER
ncbi:MAG: LON peptidase substrate-binding domain-containing protein, partial [Eubacteriales bacterium]|nr:LON peptidase substrate-binding domain-containing protein [Eubacteriales bacterium]